MTLLNVSVVGKVLSVQNSLTKLAFFFFFIYLTLFDPETSKDRVLVSRNREPTQGYTVRPSPYN